MPGTGIFGESAPVELAREAIRVDVFRYTGYRYESGQPSNPDKLPFNSEATGRKLTFLPNIRCISIRRHDGADPGEAKFAYRLDDSGSIDFDPEWPVGIRDLIGYVAPTNYTVQTDDRLCVIAYSPGGGTGGIFGPAEGGEPSLLFDGFVQLPSLTVKGNVQDASFTALGTPVRCFDYPLWRGVFRSENNYHNRNNDRPVDACRIHFNPVNGEGVMLPNATIDGDDGRTGFLDPTGQPQHIDHAVFLDPDFCEDHKTGRFWTVAMAARYVLARGNNHQAFVLNPGADGDKTFPEIFIDFTELEFLLDSWEPKDEFGIDYTDPDSYTKKPILLRDLDVTGLCWPEALARIINPHGFQFVFRLGLTDGYPAWMIDFYRVADFVGSRFIKQVMLQSPGSDLDPAMSNVAEMQLTRDMSDSVNEYTVESAIQRVEFGAVLSPLFDIDPADCATPAALEAFKESKDGTKPVSAKYREYGLDEAGEGHWDFAANARSYFTPSLAPILGGPKTDKDGQTIPQSEREKLYAVRRRKASMRLLTRDEQVADPDPGDDAEPDVDEEDEGSQQDGKKGKRARARLYLSTDYKGIKPGVWDGTGTWKAVKGWELLNDRCGIRLTAEDVEGWNTGNPLINFGVTVNAGAGKVRAVSTQAKAGETRFTLMLLTVIEGDDMVDAVAERRLGSPSRWPVRRYIESDRKYRYDVIHGPSMYNNTANDIIARDDRVAAKAEAVARRAMKEMPSFAGSITIPRITRSYTIGHRISKVIGQDLSLRMNAAANSGESSRFPLVIGLEYQFDPRQKTVLILGDSRGSEYSE